MMRRLFISAVVLTIVGGIAFWCLTPRSASHGEGAVVLPEVEIHELVKDPEGRWMLKADGQLFTGYVIEWYPKARAPHGELEQSREPQKKVQIAMKDGVVHGVSQGWYRSGQKEIEEHFLHGVPHGVRQRWDPEGNLKSKEVITNGKR